MNIPGVILFVLAVVTIFQVGYGVGRAVGDRKHDKWVRDFLDEQRKIRKEVPK